MQYLKEYKKDIVLVIVIIILFFIFSNNVAILYIKGDSMYPTYEDGNILFLKKNKSISNKDLVVLSSPESWGSYEKSFIKRIIAQEGDVITIDDNKVIVNNETPINLKREYCQSGEKITFTLDKGQYFVLGDNVMESNDSLTQYCIGNEDFLINEENLIIHGKELFLLGGM